MAIFGKDEQAGLTTDQNGVLKNQMGRAIDVRWCIPEGLRGPLIQRLSDIVRDPSETPRDVLAAASALMTASKINLANIETTMRVQHHEEIEQSLTEVEEYIASTRNEQLD